MLKPRYTGNSIKKHSPVFIGQYKHYDIWFFAEEINKKYSKYRVYFNDYSAHNLEPNRFSQEDYAAILQIIKLFGPEDAET